MKTNFYILLTLLLSFSLGNAQSDETTLVTSNKETVVVDTINAIETQKEDFVIDTEKVKESIARSSSDIRIYLNRLKNVDNLNLLFPKINKAKTA